MTGTYSLLSAIKKAIAMVLQMLVILYPEAFNNLRAHFPRR